MKNRLTYIFCISIILTLSACGTAPAAESTPALSAADIQSTAVADAWAAVTLTQAAIPTSTPTLTPMPTETATATFVVVPTMPLIQAPTLALAAPTEDPASDPCNNPPPVKPKGATVQVRFMNRSEGRVQFISFGMNQPNDQGECGTYNFSLAKLETIAVTVLSGCYWAYASIEDPRSTAKNPQALCVTDSTKAVAIWITKEVINFH